MDVLYIVIPAYNEEMNIHALIESWYPIIESHSGDGKSRLVVIDDGSKDGTYRLLKELGASRPYMTALTKANSGHGPTLIYGYRYALEHGADYIFQTDSDGQTDPDEFEEFWKLRGKYEALFGKRSKRGDGLQRLIIEKVLCGILRIYYGVRIPDANAPFRLMKRRYVDRYLSKLPKDYNLPNVMLTAFGVREHRRVKFLEISFRPRQGGENSINVKKIVKIGFKALRDFAVFRRQMDNGGIVS